MHSTLVEESGTGHGKRRVTPSPPYALRDLCRSEPCQARVLTMPSRTRREATMHPNSVVYRLSHMCLPLLCCSFLLCTLLLPSSQAQITLDGSLGPRGALKGPNYTISDDLGQIRGSNLFHSFGQFNLSRGESATFTGPNTIANILSRVTGGSPSNIDGTIRSQIPGANLFLLNPGGVIFGPNAGLKIGRAHV